MDDDTAAPAPTAFGELMECVEIVSGISQMPQGTFQPERSSIRQGSMKLQSNLNISGLELTTVPDTSSLLKTKPFESIGFYPCI